MAAKAPPPPGVKPLNISNKQMEKYELKTGLGRKDTLPYKTFSKDEMLEEVSAHADSRLCRRQTSMSNRIGVLCIHDALLYAVEYRAIVQPQYLVTDARVLSCSRAAWRRMTATRPLESQCRAETRTQIQSEPRS